MVSSCCASSYQDHLDLRAEREEDLGAMTGADGVARSSVEAGHERRLVTISGEVRARRLAYRRKGATNLYPADAALNLPAESYSHGLRRLAAVEAGRGSFDEAVAAISRAGAATIGKRQVEAVAQAAAVDFESFFDHTQRPGTRSPRRGGPVRRRQGRRHASRGVAARHQGQGAV